MTVNVSYGGGGRHIDRPNGPTTLWQNQTAGRNTIRREEGKERRRKKQTEKYVSRSRRGPIFGIGNRGRREAWTTRNYKYDTRDNEIHTGKFVHANKKKSGQACANNVCDGWWHLPFIQTWYSTARGQTLPVGCEFDRTQWWNRQSAPRCRSIIVMLLVYHCLDRRQQLTQSQRT